MTVKSSPLSVGRTGGAGADFNCSRSDSEFKSRDKLPVLRCKLSWTEAHTINRIPGRAGPFAARARPTQSIDEQIRAQQGVP